MPGFTAEELIACYKRGVFPMAEARDDPRVFLIDPEERGVIPLDGFHTPRRLARTVRAEPFDMRVDTAFEAVIDGCSAQAEDRPETWINDAIRHLYRELFARGQAHTVECWQGERLVGGLYGVSLGGAFFGESMFSLERDASKVALVHLVGRLIVGGYKLLDAQFMTEHLAQFGALEIPRADYRRRLLEALVAPADFYKLAPAGVGAAGEGVLQAITQRS
ncbi:leucyl/phenylalanyl-tRNA--protein transferase [Caulobacter sp. S45]|uniref:leucyl/phenylalanyl-tRNA--protein transferase n=1 Tax=Caulobacter sp. S45 TaxID=1641861 RepID=UPI0021104DC9|nr:leucyl/phenylalanyl-tRNA--protein transferase [Caulobacter sp. S45]